VGCADVLAECDFIAEIIDSQQESCRCTQMRHLVPQLVFTAYSLVIHRLLTKLLYDSLGTTYVCNTTGTSEAQRFQLFQERQ
jgi:hypothetical protein